MMTEIEKLRQISPQDFAMLGAQGLAYIKRVVVTDTIPVDPRKQPDNMTVLGVSGLLAEAIMNVFSDESVSGIFGGENQLF